MTDVSSVTDEPMADDPTAGPAADEARAGEAEATERTEEAAEKLVPVSESIRYRRRAQAAERELEQVQEQLLEAQRELREACEQVGRIERRQQVDQLLIEADAIDLEAARLLTEAAIGQMDEADVAAVVDDLRRHKPYLFRQSNGSAGGLSPRPRASGPPLDEAAAAAATSGDRRDLLRYLRLRREKAHQGHGGTSGGAGASRRIRDRF